MKELVTNYVNGNSQYTVVKDGMFYVECRVNGFLTKTIPFLTEDEAKLFASSFGGTNQQLLNEAH
jgi:hypothetical protein